MAHESCKNQIAVLEMNGQSVPQRWTSMREGSNTARRQCSAWDVKLSAIHREKVLASRESGYRVAHSRQVVRCHPMETLEHRVCWMEVRHLNHWATVKYLLVDILYPFTAHVTVHRSAFTAWTLLTEWQEGYPACNNNPSVDMLVWMIWLELCTTQISSVTSATSICCSKIQDSFTFCYQHTQVLL